MPKTCGPDFLPQVEDSGQFLGQMAARAFGEEGVAGVKLHARLIIRLVRAVAGDAHVAGRDALHRPVVVEQDFGGREAGEDLDAQRFGLAGQPARHIAEACGVGPFIVHERRHQERRESPICASWSAPSDGCRSPARSADCPSPASPGSARRAPWDRSPRRTGYARRPRCPFRGRRRRCSRPFSSASCLRRIAAARPATPAPTITTSYSINSRWLIAFLALPLAGPASLLSRPPSFRPISPANSLTAQSTLDDRRPMGGEMQAIDRGAADSLIGWWLEAGVDGAVSEIPRDWLGRQKLQPSAAAPRLAAATEKPADLAAFQDWLATAPALPMDRPGAIRVRSHGAEGAKLMLLSDLPAREDAAEGKPIGGEAWALTSRMLAAIGIGHGRCLCRVARLLPCPRRALQRTSSTPARPSPASISGWRARTADPVRRCAGPRPARRTAGPGARQGSPGRGRPDHRHLPSALAAAAPVGQGAGLARPVVADE